MKPLMPSSRPATEPVAVVRPILKWAGGKRQLLPTLRRYYPAGFNRYVEPFLGSGAVFLDCHNQGLLDSCEVQLSDINADVIGCYRMVRDDVEAVIASRTRTASAVTSTPAPTPPGRTRHRSRPCSFISTGLGTTASSG